MLTGTCPLCRHALKVCQSKEGILYLGCSSYPLCSFRAPYDPMLQQLRDQNARLTAELTLLRMQLTPHPEPPRPTQPRWVEVAQRQAPRSTTTLGQAMAVALGKGVA